MTKFKSPIIIILLTSFFLISTCTIDNSITGNSDQALAKPADVLEINSPTTGDDDYFWGDGVELGRLALYYYELHGVYGFCAFGVSLLQDKDYPGYTPIYPISNNIINSSYDFRDNYLSRSEKGKIYTACYYLLSKYSIENNLVNKYHNEHRDLLISSVKIAYQLQHSSSNDKILIKNDIAEKLENMLKIYRNHENHRDIDPVLDYLDLELNKYENKPKYEIASDFEKD